MKNQPERVYLVYFC